MQRKIQLTIPKPCHEQWSDFTPTQQGGYCHSCRKEVTDFTSWSEEQLKAYLRNAPSGACGRFKEEQLKVYRYDQNKPLLQKWLSVALTSLLLISSRQSFAQTQKPATEQQKPDINNDEVHQLQNADNIVVQGTITDEGGASMPGVAVRRSGTTEETASDHLGNFTLTINKPRAWDIITFDFIGMETFKYHMLTDKPHQYVTVVLKYDTSTSTETVMWAGGITIRRPWYSPRRWWWAVKGWFNSY